MIYQRVYQWGILVVFTVVLLSSCNGATPTPILIVPQPTAVSAAPLPAPVRPAATQVPPTQQPAPTTAVPAAEDAALTGTLEGTVTAAATATQADPLELPFLMKIDRISVVVGRGVLLEGRVAHGSLQANSAIEILGPQDQLLGGNVLATLVATVAREQVTVGDYAGILVEGLEANRLAPGMLLSASGAYTSYEEALTALQ